MRKEVPMMFKGELVRAIMNGEKTQTRRILKTQPDDVAKDGTAVKFKSIEVVQDGKIVKITSPMGQPDHIKFCDTILPPVKPGDLIWVRETFRQYCDEGDPGNINTEYRADGGHEMLYMRDGDGFQMFNSDGSERFIPWRPSIHMPKSAARIYLEVTDVRCERVRDISNDDAVAEGIELIGGKRDDCPVFRDYSQKYCGIGDGYGYPRNSFESLWTSIYGAESWDNDYVWAISFRVLSTTGRPENI